MFVEGYILTLATAEGELFCEEYHILEHAMVRLDQVQESGTLYFRSLVYFGATRSDKEVA